ncbi:MAG TPA: protein kinase, partial [Planctomycetota bacterium]|nr:protein kinase [Planctomycetota bacterium]
MRLKRLKIMEEKVFHQRFVAKKLLKTADDYFQWLGEDMQTHKMVVIKEFNRQTPNQMAAKEFARECQLIHKISQIVNPNIARIYVIDLKIGYYVMEYVPGQNIHDYLVGNTIPEDLALRIIIKIANALHILYSKFQILHRDIQPCNIQLESG